MSVGKSIMNIQVPAGKTIRVPDDAAAVIDSTTTYPPSTEPSSST
jgi:hypothetical protein